MNDASLSPTATRILKKPAVKAIQMLIKLYGLKADIYALRKQDKPVNQLHGFLDDHQNYNEIPYLQTKVLIPSFFKRRNSTNITILDPFIDSDTYMYMPTDIVIHLHSLIVLRMPTGKIQNYRVSDIASVDNDCGQIIKRYSLVPVVSQDILKNTQEIKDRLKEELDRFKAGRQDNYSTTNTTLTPQPSELRYNQLD